MKYTTAQLKQMIKTVPRVNLGFFPTPIYRLDNISDEYGVNIYVKRDDFTGSNLFGGNKTRKLEYLLGKAKADGAEYVFTYGATQSNHAMQTAWAAAKNGLKTVLYLAAVVPPDKSDLKANLLLDRVFGAEVHIIDLQNGESFEDAEKRSFEMGKKHIERLEAAGHKCYEVPMGGANAYGSVGYINAMVELSEQMTENNLKFDYLYHATGSGGTMAGIIAGKKMLGMDMEVHSISSMELPKDYIKGAKALAESSAELIHAEIELAEDDFITDEEHYGEGYEIPSREGTEAIIALARREGILVDPVYSGKAFGALLSDAREGKIPRGSNVLFLHTGGATVFFAEKEILGDIV